MLFFLYCLRLKFCGFFLVAVLKLRFFLNFRYFIFVFGRVERSGVWGVFFRLRWLFGKMSGRVGAGGDFDLVKVRECYFEVFDYYFYLVLFGSCSFFWNCVIFF